MKQFILILLFLLTSFSNSFSQCLDWKNFPTGESDAKTLHILYRDKFKLKKFDEALPIWDSLYRFVKLPLPNRYTHFNDGVEMLVYFAKSESDTAKKSKLINRIIEVYNDNLSCNGLNTNALSWKGYHLLVLNYNQDSVYQNLNRALEIGGRSVTPMTISYLTRLTIQFYKNKKSGFDSNFMLNQYNTIKEIVEFNSTRKDSMTYGVYWKDVESQYSQISEIFPCSWFKNKYSALILDNWNNDTILYDISKIISKNCGKEDSLFTSLNYRIYEIRKIKLINFEIKIIESDTATIYRKILACGNLIQYDSEFSKKYKEKEWYLSSKLVDSNIEWIDNDTKSEIIYRYAYKLYEEGDFISSRNYCRIASRFCPYWGDPYILIGTMYVNSGFKCSPTTNGVGFDASSCVWVAIDEWNKAKSVDRDCVNRVNDLIQTYSKFLPTKSDLLLRNLDEGSTYQVGCWINQFTKVRGI